MQLSWHQKNSSLAGKSDILVWISAGISLENEQYANQILYVC